MTMSARLIRWMLFGAIVALWESLPRIGLVPELFLAPLSKAVAVGLADWRLFGGHLMVTLYEAAIAIVLACGGGIVIGTVIGAIPYLSRLLLPVLSSVYAIPIVMIYPIFTVWLGIGSESKIAYATASGILPAALTTASGIRTIDPQYLLAARSMGATFLQQLTRVVVPASVPTVLAAIRIGGALVIVGVVVGEMLTSTAGIGYLITGARTMLDTPRVFAGILVVLIIIYFFDLIMQQLERRTAGRMVRRAQAIEMAAMR